MTTTGAAEQSIWRNRDFRLVWTGGALSELGNGVSQLAYPLLMLIITGSPVAAGAVAAVRALPFLLLGLPAGVLVDRWDRKRTMIFCDVIRAFNMATIPAALALWHLTPAHLFVTGIVGGVCYVFYSAAEGACLPNVVRKDQLTAAVSSQGAAESAVRVVSGPIGGALLQLSRGLPFLVDALTFAASAVCLSFVRSPFQQERDPDRPPARLRHELMEGLRWLVSQPALRLIVLVAAGLQTAISGIALVTIVAARDNGASAVGIGVLYAVFGLGGVVGALLAPRLKDRLGLGGALLSVVWLHGALWVLMAFAPNLVVIGVAIALFAVSMPCFGVVALSYQLAITPDHLLGRVGTAFNFLLWAAAPLGGAIAGVLLGLMTTRNTSLVFAAWVLVLALAVTVGTGIRQLEDEPSPSPVAT